MTQREVIDPACDRPASVTSYARTSPLLGAFQVLIWIGWLLNAIEYLKRIFVAVAPAQYKVFARSLAIDFYMVIKWAVLAVFIYYDIDQTAARWLMSYMIVSALFSYFYYHVWRETPHALLHVQQLRRTLSFILSLFFSLVAYAYLIWSGYRDQIEWVLPGKPEFTDALLLSFANAFTAGFTAVAPLTREAQLLLAGETLFVFGFVVIVIANSVPTGK